MHDDELPAEEFEAVYVQYRDPIWRFLVSLTRNQAEAEDLFQSVFLKLLELCGQGRIRRQGLRAYIFKVAYNQYVDVYRRKRFESGREPAEMPASGGPPDQSARIQAIIDETLADDVLSERARAVLKMRLLGRLKIEEICTALGISRSTVYADLEPAMDHLRVAFEKAGLTPDALS